MLLDDAVNDMPMVKTRYDLKPRLHDTTGCQTGCQTGLTAGLTTVLNEQHCSFNRLSTRVVQPF